MARAVRAAGSPTPRNPALPATRGNYLKEVWDELKKVLWPTRTELSRMTGIVIATVIMFACVIGIADYGLGLVVKQLYAAPGTSSHATPAPVLPGGRTNVKPSTIPVPVPSGPAASAPAAPAPSKP